MGPSVPRCHIPPLTAITAITALDGDSQVYLCVGPKVLIDISLQMDGQMWDAQDGPLYMYKPLLQPA